MAGTTAQGFFPFEVVAELLCLVGVLLCLYHLTYNKSIPTELLAHDVAAFFIFGQLFGNDVLSTLECHLHVLYIASHKIHGCLLRIRCGVGEQHLCQWLQTLFTGHLSTCAPLGAVGQIDVLQFRRVPTLVNALLKFGCQLAKFGDGLEDCFLAFGYFLEFLVKVADLRYLHLIESSRTLLAVTGNEGDGTSFVEQFQRILHAVLRQ